MIEIPGVLHTDANGNTRMVSLATRLLADRIVLVTGEVTDALAESVTAQLLYLDAESHEKPIKMIVTGPGGSVTAGFSIISTMEVIQAPVYTTVMGEVASMSAVIAASGEKGHRVIYPNSRYMLHTVSAGTSGKIQDMTITLNEIKRTNDTVFKHLAKVIGKSETVLRKDLDRDFWMNEEEAVKYGCADKIQQKNN